MKIETPSKVILFGEHAVVYGYRAISMAINLSSSLEINKLNDNTKDVVIDLQNLNKVLKTDLNTIMTSDPRSFEEFKYCICAIKNTIKYLNINPNSGFRLTVKSDIPVSCGLGSSASITIGTIKAVSRLYNRDIEKSDVAKLGYMVEKSIQGKASITDTFTITYGGVLEIKDNNKFRKIHGDFLNFLKDCKFLIVFAEKRKKKTAELVNYVSKLKDKYKIFEEIDEIIERALNTYNKEEFGKLMTKNHNLLKKLNISTPKIDKIVEIGNKYGFGAKLTGAGGGGCVIILINEKKEYNLLKELNKENVSIFKCNMVV